MAGQSQQAQVRSLPDLAVGETDLLMAKSRQVGSGDVNA